MLKLVPATVAVALAAGLAVITTSGAQVQGGPGPERTIVLYEKEDAASVRFVVANPFKRLTNRISAGDGFVAGVPLFTDAALTQSAGRLRVHCVATNGSRRFSRVTFLCDGAYRLSDGTILLSGLVKIKDRAQVTKLAVTGGTDAYEGARGSVTGDAGNSKDTIHLLAG